MLQAAAVVAVGTRIGNGESRCQFSTSSRPSRSTVPRSWSSSNVIAKPEPSLKTIVQGRGGRTRTRKAGSLRRPPASLPWLPFFPSSNFLPVRAADSPTASLPVDLFAAFAALRELLRSFWQRTNACAAWWAMSRGRTRFRSLRNSRKAAKSQKGRKNEWVYFF